MLNYKLPKPSYFSHKNVYDVNQVKFWPKSAQILKIDFGKPQKLGNFPVPWKLKF